MTEGFIRSARSALRRLRREEDGFTLAELLSAQVVAVTVLAAAGLMVIISIRSEQRVSDRVNSVTQGRIASNQIRQRISSQVCLYPGEYVVNGSTGVIGAASIVQAGADKILYFADISERASGSTSGVGFLPFLRYLEAPTPGTGRRGGFIDAYRESTGSTGGGPSAGGIPYRFTLDRSLAQLGAGATSQATSVLQRIGTGVTAATTGTTGATLPYFQYYDVDNLGATGVPITLVNGVVPSDQIETIGRIRVNFRILGENAFDGKTTATGTLDDRTENFATDIFLRTSPNICDQLGS